MLREMLGRMPQNRREENVQQEKPQPQPETQRDILKEQKQTPVNGEKQEARNDIRNLIPAGILLLVIVAVNGGVKHRELKRKRRIYSRDTKAAGFPGMCRRRKRRMREDGCIHRLQRRLIIKRNKCLKFL